MAIVFKFGFASDVFFTVIVDLLRRFVQSMSISRGFATLLGAELDLDLDLGLLLHYIFLYSYQQMYCTYY